MHGNMVLPPIGPLFASNPHHSHITHHSRQLVGSETLVALRTPTSIHAHAYMNGAFPSSSPVKKDLTSNSGSTVASTKKSAAAGATKKSMAALNLDSPKAVAITTSPFHVDASKDEEGSASPTCEDEKLRLSRERNRLHAQRTRIRKRELLESLKERIHTLQSEHTLLKQAYEFHATAVCLLALGAGPECDHPSLKHLEGMSDAALELFDSTSTLNACLDDEDDMDDFAESGSGAMMVTHEKSCEWYTSNEDDNDHHSDSGSSPSCSCTCQASVATDQETTASGSQQLNSNGKRVHSSSSTLQMGGSKEEREQLRRERNRLHARRARLRKKLILERSQQAVQELRKRNEYLREHLGMLITSIYGASSSSSTSATEAASSGPSCP